MEKKNKVCKKYNGKTISMPHGAKKGNGVEPAVTSAKNVEKAPNIIQKKSLYLLGGRALAALFIIIILVYIGPGSRICSLLNRYAFCEVSRFVDIVASKHGGVVGQQLQRHNGQHRLQKLRHIRDGN